MNRLQLGSAIALMAGGLAFAGESGTEDEARKVLASVESALKADKTAAIAKINAGGFNDRDLYPFCAGPDAIVTAHGVDKQRIGKNQMDFKDANGKAYGAEFRSVARVGEVGKVSYVYPRPGAKVPVEKVALVTKVGDQVCGVGYYK
jgi:hypothetical protein